MFRTITTLALTTAALLAVPVAAHANGATEFAPPCPPSVRSCPAPHDPIPPRWSKMPREVFCHRPVVCALPSRSFARF